ncbi:Protein of unknown function DUF4666 [Dillenia turbinata]|uniref:Uncharacterized protein n=1 Tax=Dillenia turbinata TaxID=194707 RepID=A0AAN8YU09_9MAGN
MAALQRSTISFRRSGSSGVVWDEKFVSGVSEDGTLVYRELRHCKTVGGMGMMARKEPVGAPPSCPRSYSSSVADTPSKKIPKCHVGDKGIAYGYL